MESAGHVSVPLRTGKKMKKRKELDALVANSMNKRSCGPKRGAVPGGGISSQDQLLSESTDDQEYWVAGATKRPRARIARRRACGTLFRACSAILIFGCVVATTTVLWLFITVREDMAVLRSELHQVVASSQGVPEALQKCHTISKNLQHNQTLMLGQLLDLKQQVENLTMEVRNVQTELNRIQEKLNNAPEYVNIPTQISEVSGSVANLGSQIKDLTTTITSLKDYKDKAETITTALKTNVTSLSETVSKLQNLTQAPVAADNRSNVEIAKVSRIVDQIKNNVSTINTTLSNRIQWLYDDQTKDHKNVDVLSEIGQNISARVTTLEGICGKCTSDEISLKAEVNELSKVMQTLNTKVQGLSTEVPLLKTEYHQLGVEENVIKSKVERLESPVTDSGSPSPAPSIVNSMSTLQEPEDKPKLVTPTLFTPSTTTIKSKPVLLQTNN